MDKTTMRDAAAAVAAGAAVLLLAALSLGWHTVDVTVGGVVGISATASGWSGAGLVAGLLAIAMLLFMIRPMRRDGAVDLVQATVTAVLAVGALAFTVAEALTGSASVTTPATAVEVGDTLWPAYAAVVVAAILAAGAVTAFALVLRGATAPSRAAHPT